MNAVAYCHPFVPPEWIAAHGLRPCWLPCRAGDEPAVWVRRGVCPVAAARLDDFAGELPAEAVVLTTTCDQIRYAAALLQHRGTLPVFLMHVPRTWQTAAVRTFYREELSRLGRFLVGCGGTRAGRRRPFPGRCSDTIGREHRSACGVERCRPAHLHGRSPPSAAISWKLRRRHVVRHTPCAAPNGARRVATTTVPWHWSAGRCRRAITNC